MSSGRWETYFPVGAAIPSREPTPSPPSQTPQPTTTLSSSLPTDVASLHTIINALQAELKASASVNNHLAASVARQLQAEQARPLTPSTTILTSTTTDATTSPTIPQSPCTIASGCGAASPEVFQQVIKKNWHGRLGRTHMVDVDGLSATALAELDCFVRRRLHAIYPRGHDKVESAVDADTIFASLAALGLRLEDRGAYADLPVVGSSTLSHSPIPSRVSNSVAWYTTQGRYAEYWNGFASETLMELARYRGLLDDEGYLRVEY